MKNFPIAKDALIYFFVLLFSSIVFYFLFIPLSIISVVLLAFVLFFFRNPNRKVPESKDIIVSPADGRILSISDIYEDTFLNSKAIKVSIFLSIFNVHINRSPIAGVVKYTNYRPGEFFPAFKGHASDLNERNTIGIEASTGMKVLVHQITGFVARRIVCWSKLDDSLKIGERFGLIKFGSCTEIILPTNVDIKVKVGDKVRGANTIIGVIT